MLYYLKAIYLSLFSREFYMDLVTNRKFSGFAYIFILTLLISFPSSVRLNKQIADVFDYSPEYTNYSRYIDVLENQFPKVTYNNGSFTFDREDFDIISIRPENNFMVVDPENELSDLTKFPDAMILKPDRLIYNNKNSDLQVFNASQLFESFNPYFNSADSGYLFNSQKFFEDLAAFLKFSLPVIFLLVSSVTFVKYIIWVFLFSNMAYLMFLSRYKPFILSGKIFFRISCFSFTPVAIFEFCRIVFNMDNLFYYPVIISVIINVIYLNYIISGFKNNIIKKV